MQKQKNKSISRTKIWADGQDVGLTEKKYCPRNKTSFSRTGQSLSAHNADMSVVRKSFKTQIVKYFGEFLIKMNFFFQLNAS
jgi:hypothetical protein